MNDKLLKMLGKTNQLHAIKSLYKLKDDEKELKKQKFREIDSST